MTNGLSHEQEDLTGMRLLQRRGKMSYIVICRDLSSGLLFFSRARTRKGCKSSAQSSQKGLH